MSVVDFKKGKEKKIQQAYNNAINIFGIAKFEDDIKINISSEKLKKFLGLIYDSYFEKKVLKHYIMDINFYLNTSIELSRKTKEEITSTFLIDNLLCDLYQKRIEEGKKNREKLGLKRKLDKGEESYGRKYN